MSGFAARSTNFRDSVLKRTVRPLDSSLSPCESARPNFSRNGITLAAQALPFRDGSIPINTKI
jgi:hypothetical protein